MKDNFLPKSILDLKKLELEFNIVKVFRYKDTTSWIRVKNYLYALTLQKVNTNNFKVKEFLTKNGIFLILLSIKNYFLNLFNKEEKILFVGAGSGLFFYNNKILDTFFPDYLDKDEVIYFLSGDYVDKLIKYKSYLIKNKAIIYSYLVGPLKIIFTKIFAKFIKFDISSDILEFLKNNNMPTSKESLKSIHANFIVTIYLYKIFLMPLKIKKAYIVSAYSNSEIIYILKKRGVEVIELQHGVIGSVHRAYNYALNDKLLPTPNKIDVYDSFWKEELIKAGYFKANQINVVGRWKYDLIDKNLTIYNNRYIVFTGQGGFYKEIIEFFNRAVGFLEKNSLKLLYLPHPNETKEIIDNLKNNIKNKNAIILSQDKEFTTEQYIYNSIAHVSVYSSCHFDTIYYKDKTYVYDILEDNPMSYYIYNFKDKFIPIKTIDEISIA